MAKLTSKGVKCARYIMFDYTDFFFNGAPCQFLIKKLLLEKGRQNKWRCRGLNSGPHTCKACALPLSYIPYSLLTFALCNFFPPIVLLSHLKGNLASKYCKRNWYNSIGGADYIGPLIGAISLLTNLGIFGCLVTPLARFIPH